MRDNSELKVEAEKLRKMQPNVRRQSTFGDNHHDAIDMQIEVLLDETLDIEGVNGGRDDGDILDNVADAAIAAIEWREEERDAAPPSEDWKSLLVN